MDKCRHCGTELLPTHTGPCPKCGGKSRVLDLAVSDRFSLHESIRLKQKRNGYDEFMIESIQGWFPSGDPKLNKGVEMSRIIDRDKDKYDQVVTDVATGEVIHEEHEPLSQHKPRTRQSPKNVKKPKQPKEKKGKGKIRRE